MNISRATIESLIDKHFPFTEFRPEQRDSISWIIDEFFNKNKKYVVIEAPVGSGKSVVGYTVARIVNELVTDMAMQKKEVPIAPQSVLVTKTKVLQKQYEQSFEDVPSIWGVTNYPCIYYKNSKYEDKDVHHGDHLCSVIKNKKDGCESTAICPYVKKRDIFLSSSIGVTNFHYLLASRITSKLAVFDECHSLESVITDYVGFTLSTDALSKALSKLNIANLELSEEITLRYQAVIRLNYKSYTWKTQFLSQAKDLIETIEKITGLALATCSQDTYHLIEKSIKYFSGVKGKLEALFEVDKEGLAEIDNWIMAIQDKDKVEFKPIDITGRVGRLFDGFEKVLFMSGTIIGDEQFCRTLGVTDWSFRSVNSHFNPENHRIYLVGLPGLNYKNTEDTFPVYINVIDNIVSQMKGQRGIIHCPSYKLAETLIAKSKYKRRMVLPKLVEGQDIDTILLAAKDTVLVSPSLFEGVDLRDDLSVFQIISKVPFLSLGDNLVKEKLKRNADWYSREAIIKIVQGCGRSVRSETDQCLTFILDSNFDRLYNEYPSFFPTWFNDSVIPNDNK